MINILNQDNLRPKLFLVSPLVARIMAGLAVLNISLGIYLFHGGGLQSSQVVVVNNIFSIQTHGLLFIALGVSMAYFYLVNNWDLLRKSVLFGLALSSIWMIALFFLVSQGSNPFILMMWSFITYIKAFTYIYFMPGGRRYNDL